MKTGIFSGSFNPVHIGHLALANYLCEYEGLDEVWFLVTPHNPLKEEDELMDDAFRLKLVQLAIEGYPKFKASDIEFNLSRPSYTIHTLDKLKETYPDREFYLIIGSDNWVLFPCWYQSERILVENHILVYPRPGYPVSSDSLPENVKVVSSPTFEIKFYLYSPSDGGRERCSLLPPSGGLRGIAFCVFPLKGVWLILDSSLYKLLNVLRPVCE